MLKVNNTNIKRLIKLERERYNRLLRYIETNVPSDTFNDNLNLLVNLMSGEYQTNIDFNSSFFSLEKYNIDDETYLYNYEVSFNRGEEVYHSIVLTYLNIFKLRDNVYKLDVKNKKALRYFKPIISRNDFTDKFIEETFSSDIYPYIMYSRRKENMRLDTFYNIVKYYGKESNLICVINPDLLSDPIDVYAEEIVSKDYVFPWVLKNISKDDGPTKLVEMAGYYNTSEKLHNLVKRI